MDIPKTASGYVIGHPIHQFSRSKSCTSSSNFALRIRLLMHPFFPPAVSPQSKSKSQPNPQHQLSSMLPFCYNYCYPPEINSRIHEETSPVTSSHASRPALPPSQLHTPETSSQTPNNTTSNPTIPQIQPPAQSAAPTVAFLLIELPPPTLNTHNLPPNIKAHTAPPPPTAPSPPAPPAQSKTLTATLCNDLASALSVSTPSDQSLCSPAFPCWRPQGGSPR